MIGAKRARPFFEEHAKDNSEMAFLFNSLGRERVISEPETPAHQNKLMRAKWSPDLYR